MKPNDALAASLPRWPAAFNQVPKWAFEDADVFALEHERIFRGTPATTRPSPSGARRCW
jgi:hypothetical protein